MDISKLLNPTTPPASPGNNAGSSGNGSGGGGGGGSGGDSSIPALGGHGTNNSNDNTTEHDAPSPTYPPMDFFNNPNPNRKRYQYLDGRNRDLHYYNHKKNKYLPIYTDWFHERPLDVYWSNTGYKFEFLQTDPPKPMPYAWDPDSTSKEIRLYVDEVPSWPPAGKLYYDPSGYKDRGKIIYYKNEFGYVRTHYVVPKTHPLRLSNYNHL